MFAATCNSRLAPVSSPAATDIIFVKDVALPGWFMKFAWSLLSLFTAATTAKAVAMAVILASIAAVALFCHLKHEKPLFIKYTESRDDLIQMIDISIAHVCVNKKPLPRPTLDNEPVEPIKTLPLASAPLEPSPYLVNVGDLFHESPQVSTAPARRMSFADAVGYEFMEVCKPRNPNVLGYDVYIADLFGMDDDPSAHIPDEESPKSNVTSEICVQLPARRLSYADAVGYEHMEIKKPRNPKVLGYDVNIADLFEVDDDSFAHIPDETLPKSNVINEWCVQVPVCRMSYADAVGYEFMEVKKPRNPNVLDYDVYLCDLFSDNPDEDSQKPALMTCRCIETLPVRRMSYADALGYEFMEIKTPRNPDVLGYDVYLGDLFQDEAMETVSPSVARRFSYAEAVSYDFMETRRPRPFHTVESYVYLGDLFAEEEMMNISPSPPIRRLSYAEAVGYDNIINRPRYSHAIESSAYYEIGLSDKTEFNFDAGTVENHKNYFIQTVRN